MVKLALLLFSICYVGGLECFAQSSKLEYTIAPWLNNKKAAASLTFDDAVNGQFTVALPLLNQHGFRSTFFVTIKIIPGQLGNWNLIRDAARAGHEIANHSLTHPYLDSLTADSISAEFSVSNRIIDSNIQSQRSVTHAYPFGHGGNESEAEKKLRLIARRYFIGARATRNKSIPYNEYLFAHSADDYFKINSDMIVDTTTTATLQSHLDESIAAGGWYVPTYHGIENGWIIVPKAVFEQQLNVFDHRKDSLWIAPFDEVLKYHQERNCAQLTLKKDDAKQRVLLLTDTLHDQKTWNQALTINLKITGWKIREISQDGVSIAFAMNGDEAVFNAVPGDKAIVISKQ